MVSSSKKVGIIIIAAYKCAALPAYGFVEAVLSYIRRIIGSAMAHTIYYWGADTVYTVN
jgi:hypothetical protein